METYTIIKHGKSIQHCLDIPSEFLDKELEITIKPTRKGGGFRNKIELILEKNKGINPFESITDPVAWQKERRREW